VPLSLLERVAVVVLAHRGRAVVLLGAVFLLAAAGAKDLLVDMDTMAFFGSDDPEVPRLEAFKEFWGQDDARVIVLVEPDDGTLLTPARLRRLDAVTAALADDPGVLSALSVTTVPRLAAHAPGVLDMTPVGEAVPDADAPGWPAFRDRLLGHPLWVPYLLSADGRVAAIVVELDGAAADITAIRPLVFALRDILEGFNGQDGLRFHTAGIPAVRTDFFEQFFKDQARTVPAISVFMLLLMGLLFRRVHGVVAAMAAAAIPTAMVFGIMGWTGRTIGLLNQAYVTVLPVIAVADAIHLVSRFHEEVRRRAPPGKPLDPALRAEAIRAAVRRVGAACALTSLTTGIGFLSLYVAEMPVLREFGLYAALGIAFAYGAVLLIVPLVLSTARGAVPEGGREEAPTRVDRALRACADLTIRRPAAVLAVTAVVMVVFVGYGARVQVDNHLTGMLEEDHPTSRANRIADGELGGIIALEVDLQGAPGSMKDPDILRAMIRLEEWALARDDVRGVGSPGSWVATMQELTTGRREVPATARGVAQLLLLSEGAEGLTRMLDTSTYGRARVTLRVADEGGRVFERFSDAAAEAVAEQFDGLPVTAHVTGTAHVAYRGINNITEDLRNSVLLAFLTIALVIGLLFRSLRVTLICLVPNALPLIVGYGLLGAMGWLLDPLPAVTFTMALGIAVDDTIHLMVRFQEEIRAGKGRDEALRASVLHTGRAVFVTTVLLCAGFGVNVFSAFSAFVLFGALGSSVIFTALICDVLVLPSLLRLFWK